MFYKYIKLQLLRSIDASSKPAWVDYYFVVAPGNGPISLPLLLRLERKGYQKKTNKVTIKIYFFGHFKIVIINFVLSNKNEIINNRVYKQKISFSTDLTIQNME